MDRKDELRAVLDTIMAWCAEVDMMEGRPATKPEMRGAAAELVGRLSKMEGYGDWNGTIGWALQQVARVQLPERTAGIVHSRDPSHYRNAHLTSALLNLIALCTMWIREIESRPEPPASDVLGRLREKTTETVGIWKTVPYEQQK